MRFIATVLLATAFTAQAATDQEIRKAFEQAQKKGAVAVMENRCGGPSSLYFSGSTKEQIAKASAALSAMAAAGDRVNEGGCAGGQGPGDIQVLELYPDGTVKAR